MENTLENIYKSVLKFLEPLTPEETYATVVNEALKLVKAEFGSILLNHKGDLRRVYASSPLLFKIKPTKNGYLQRVFKSRKPMMASSNEIELINSDIKVIDGRSIIIVPLSYRKQSVGVLTAASYQGKIFTTQDLSVLKTFGSLASLAIRKTQLYSETRKALETRDLFISMAAHELRTPLTSISGYIQLLHSKLADSNTPEARWIRELSAENTRLTNLVKELLEINRIKSGQFHYVWKECSLREIIGRAINNFRFTHPERKIIFDDCLESKTDLVVGDFDKLLQVVINLIGNAIKFSSISSDILITLKAYASLLSLSVEDHGKGITKEDLPKIFEGFYRGKNNSIEGIGLGLYLAKDITTRHRGSIGVKSKINKGTTFEVKLPQVKV